MIDFYAATPEPPADVDALAAKTEGLLRVLLTTIFPCGVVEGYPDLTLLEETMPGE